MFAAAMAAYAKGGYTPVAAPTASALFDVASWMRSTNANSLPAGITAGTVTIAAKPQKEKHSGAGERCGLGHRGGGSSNGRDAVWRRVVRGAHCRLGGRGMPCSVCGTDRLNSRDYLGCHQRLRHKIPSCGCGFWHRRRSTQSTCRLCRSTRRCLVCP